MRCSHAFVPHIYCLLACLCTALKTHAISPPPQTLSNRFATTSLLNTTALDVTIDPRFGIRALYAETDLPITACFMNVVELLAQYAELEWLSKVRQRRGVVLPSYPQVEIAVLPAAPETSIEVRTIVWGIWIGIRDMVRKKQFHEAEFELLWEDQVVAYIYFTKPMDLEVTGSNRTLDAESPLTLLHSPNVPTNGMQDISNFIENSSSALSAGRFGWHPLFPPEAKTLTVVEVFLTVMAGMKNVAPHPALDKVPGPYASAALDVDANMQFYLHRRRSPRQKPPFFQYIHIINALRLIPGYMLEKRRFSELFFSIDVSGVPVGEGYLQKGPYTPRRFVLGADYNASLS